MFKNAPPRTGKLPEKRYSAIKCGEMKKFGEKIGSQKNLQLLHISASESINMHKSMKFAWKQQKKTEKSDLKSVKIKEPLCLKFQETLIL